MRVTDAVDGSGARASLAPVRCRDRRLAQTCELARLPVRLGLFRASPPVTQYLFLTETELGKALATGWQVRLELLRRWGRVSEFDDLPASAGVHDSSAPVVAVTLARLKVSEVPRFIRWGKPVEELVPDHPGTTLALAAMRPPHTVCTFSVWRSYSPSRELNRR